jgi:hypothetical protein
MVVPPAPVRLWADAALLERALTKLFAHTAESRESGSHLRLTLEQRGEEALVRLALDGEGATDRQTGPDVGLALAVRLVEMHGGRVNTQGPMLEVQLPLGAAFRARAQANAAGREKRTGEERES